MNPSETSDGLEYELDAFQKGFVFWESSKAEYMPPIDDAGRREWMKGFLQAHADYPDTLDPESGETAQEALDRCWGGIRTACAESNVERYLRQGMNKLVTKAGLKTELAELKVDLIKWMAGLSLNNLYSVSIFCTSTNLQLYKLA
jgi:hypothetical protein